MRSIVVSCSQGCLLCRVRLDHPRHDLLNADPAQVIVTDIAYRWGFSSPSRFTSY